MRLIRHIADYQVSLCGAALAVGNFDGFHQGHQAVIAKMKLEAAVRGLVSAVMIFEPQPLEFFGREVPRLFSLRDKLKAFKRAGVELVFCVPFTKAFCSKSPAEFVSLLQKLNIKSVIVGSQFNFGKNGSACFDDLKDLCEKRQIAAFAIDAVTLDGERISSTKIRQLLQDGKLAAAAKMLGRPYSIAGRVVCGSQLGRTLGFPTANLSLHRRVSPLDGVFAVKVSTPFGVYSGAANVGSRPTVGQSAALLEVNLFDFNQDLYGREIEVYFIAKLRPEIKFADLSALRDQLSLDRSQAAEVLKQQNIQL